MLFFLLRFDNGGVRASSRALCMLFKAVSTQAVNKIELVLYHESTLAHRSLLYALFDYDVS